MITPQNTSIVFVHGAYHSPYHYEPLTNALKELGWTVRASQLPSAAGNETQNFDQDVAVARKDIEAGLADGKDVAVIAHSWGGMIAGEATKGLQKSADSSKPGVVRLIYICAFALHLGHSLVDALSDAPFPPPWYDISEDQKFLTTKNEKEYLYNDFTDDKLVEEYVSLLKPQSLPCMASKATWEPFKEIETAYILTTNDKAIEPTLQEKMVKDAMITKVVRLDASHSPWVVKRDEVVQAILDSFAGKL